MNYRSHADLARAIALGAHRVPHDVDLIVGIPRSGLLAATVLALHLNHKVCELSGFLENRPLRHGQTRKSSDPLLQYPQQARHVLVIDDSVNSGAAMQAARELLEGTGAGCRFTYAAVFAVPESRDRVDLHFEVVPQPRAFEWNLMHRPLLESCCVDVDGVLCHDPLPEENDDGERYRAFLLGARPIVLPTYPIGHLVTSRLEKYRAETVAWLARHGVAYRHLHMLDLPDAATRRKLGVHGSFKAAIYAAQPAATLFIESEPRQAAEICRLSGKPTLCYATQELYRPGLTFQSIKVRHAPALVEFARGLGGRVKQLLPGAHGR